MRGMDDFYRSLKLLNRLENAGRNYYRINHENLSVEQYAFLKNHPEQEDLLKLLATPAAAKESAALRQQFRDRSTEKGLDPQFFLPEGKNFEIEQLLRYVDIPAHKHDFIELVCVLNGQCEHIIEEERYINHAGDFTVIPPGVRHELHAYEDCVCLTTKIRSAAFVKMFSGILLDNEVLAGYFSQSLYDPYYHCVLVIHCGEDEYVKESMLRLYLQQIEQKPYAEKFMVSLWNALLAYMLQNYQDTASFLVSNVMEQKEMIRILAYIYENYRQVTLSSAAAHFHMTAPYLSSRIHKVTGRTFSEHLKSYKLQRSTELLINTDLKLDLICEEVGYADTSQFIRLFKETYGTTPVKYRRINRPKTSRS